MNKYVIILGCAFNPSNKQVTAFGDERINQYLEGLAKFKELAQKFPAFDFILVDNTVSSGWEMPENLKKSIASIPRLKTLMFFDNELASKNKGCGVLVGWKKLVETGWLKSYEYVVYFEPRQKLLDFEFFERFLQKQANYFQIRRYRVTANTHSFIFRQILKLVPIYRKLLNNGLFSLKTAAFETYVRQTNLQAMADKVVSLEDDMYKNLKHIPHIRVERLGYVWHNAFIGKDIEF